MSFIHSIVELEGVVIDVRKRYFRAHKEAVNHVGFEGPPEDEFWRLIRTSAADDKMVPYGKTRQVQEYQRLRDERLDAAELMELDSLQPGAAENLRLLKQMGTSHLVTFCRNREGINATLDRLEVWMHFDRKEVLPQDQDRRVALLRELKGSHGSALAIAGTIPFAYAAGQADCCVVGLKTGLAYPKYFHQVGVDLVFDSLDDLTDALARRDQSLQRAGLI